MEVEVINTKGTYLEKLHGFQRELIGLLIGMDYCLDWKPEPSAWSARQVVYHILGMPGGGLHHVLWGAISGELDEYEIWSGLDNMTSERSVYDLEQIREDISEVCQGISSVIEGAGEDDFEKKEILARLRTLGINETRTLETLLKTAFSGHWREHLQQIRDLREGLGM